MKKSTSLVFTIIGLALVITGLLVNRSSVEKTGIMITLPYLCIGIGCGMFGHGMGDIVSRKAIQNYSEVSKQIEIEKNDERNIEISNRAKAKAYDAMIYIFGAMLMSLGLMYTDIYVVLLLVIAYLTVVGIYIYYISKYNKEM